MAKGSLVIIGGALNPCNKMIYTEFINLGGGPNAIRIAIIPAAGSSPIKSGRNSKAGFIRYGVPAEKIKVFPLAVTDDRSTSDVDESQWSRNAFDKSLAGEILDYNAVFFVGGDQARYRETLMDKEGNDSPLLKSIRSVFHSGGVIGGASAGAAIMSDPAIISGNPVEAAVTGYLYRNYVSAVNPYPGKEVLISRGLGLFTPGLIDQHFGKKGRTGRLLAVLLGRPEHTMGVGIDEDTAIVYDGSSIKVIGNSGVIIIDTSKAVIKKNNHTEGIVLHYLESGDTLYPGTGEFHIDETRSIIKRGDEYNDSYPTDTNIFGQDAVKNILTTGLTDNTLKQSEGLTFRMDEKGKGKGLKLVFSKQESTAGYFGEIDGRDSYSVLNARLDIFSITVQVNPGD
ncbi:MAG: cyanophycinase [bacterium]|nr:cyanophycinase [bacterium]